MVPASKNGFQSFFSHVGELFSECYDRSCRFTYIVGIQAVRVLRRSQRWCMNYLRPIGFLLRHLYSISLGRYFYGLIDEIASLRHTFLHDGEESAGKIGSDILFQSPHSNKGFLRGLFLDIMVPVACIAVLCGCIRYWNGINFCLTLSNQGQIIGTIKNEKVYEEATEMVSQRMVHDTSQEDTDVKYAPSFHLVTQSNNFKSKDAVCDSLIQQSNGIIEEASGLYIDGELEGSVKSSADLRYMLQSRLDNAKGNDKSVTARFVKNIDIVAGLYPTTSIYTTEAMRQYINGTLTSGTMYTVKAGDTAASIAAANHISLDQLRRINRNLGDSIKPGDLIQLQVSEPTLAVELTKTVTYEKKLPFSTITQQDSSQYNDFTKVLVQGAEGKQRCVDTVHTVNGVETGRENISKTVLVQPVNKIVLTGTRRRPVNEKGVASGSFLWPVPSLHSITSPFGTRWGEFHKGIDISGSGAYGSTIVASDGGIVSLAGWNDGYGRCVIIDHQNGKRTLYGHCSSLLVTEGEAVSKGQPIARVGSSGNSTGSHLHFEVISSGSNVNPLRYVS